MRVMPAFGVFCVFLGVSQSVFSGDLLDIASALTSASGATGDQGLNLERVTTENCNSARASALSGRGEQQQEQSLFARVLDRVGTLNRETNNIRATAATPSGSSSQRATDLVRIDLGTPSSVNVLSDQQIFQSLKVINGERWTPLLWNESGHFEVEVPGQPSVVIEFSTASGWRMKTTQSDQSFDLSEDSYRAIWSLLARNPPVENTGAIVAFLERCVNGRRDDLTSINVKGSGKAVTDNTRIEERLFLPQGFGFSDSAATPGR